MYKKNAEKQNGVKLIYFTNIMLALSFLCSILFANFAIRLYKNYSYLMSLISDYTESNKAISELEEASDFLTNQARLFCLKEDETFLRNYLYEVENLKTRENALDVIKMTHNNDSVFTNTSMALNESVYIESLELYAMKLIVLAKNNISEIPPLINDVQISKEAMNLSASDKLENAKKILFTTDYLSAKDRFSDYCSKASRALIYNFLDTKDNMNKYVLNRFILLILVAIILFVLMMIFALSVIFLFIRPIKFYCKSIMVGEPITKAGAAELQTIVGAYNRLCEHNAEKANLLKHKAEHDPLTNLINRAAFDEIKDILRDAHEPIAYLLIDVDFFKQINDVYGHQTGDKVLKRIANILSEQFRDSDYVARVGGDEFAVIMTNFGNSPTEIIKNKIDNMNKILQSVDAELPSISLSVGVSFSPEGYVDELVGQADAALYKVKKGGRCNCSFYQEFKS